MAKCDGTGLCRLVDRGGHEGVMRFADVPKSCGGARDVPCWSRDSRRVQCTGKVDDGVRTMQVSLGGETEGSTHSLRVMRYYRPRASVDG